MTNEHLDFENFSGANIKSLSQGSRDYVRRPLFRIFDRPPTEKVRFNRNKTFEMKVDGNQLNPQVKMDGFQVIQ